MRNLSFPCFLPSPTLFTSGGAGGSRARGTGQGKGEDFIHHHPFSCRVLKPPGLICEGSLLTLRWVLEYYMEHCILITQLRWFCDLKYLEDFSLPWRLKIWWNLPDSPSRVEKDVVPENWFKWDRGLSWLPPRRPAFQHNGYSSYGYDRKTLFLEGICGSPEGCSLYRFNSLSSGNLEGLYFSVPQGWVLSCGRFWVKHFNVV